MIRGVTKQAVVVRPGDGSDFELAVFILSPERRASRVSSPEELVALADELVARYAAEGARRGPDRRLRCALAGFALGAALTAALFLLFPWAGA